jgi:hypothetical protein
MTLTEDSNLQFEEISIKLYLLMHIEKHAKYSYWLIQAQK